MIFSFVDVVFDVVKNSSTYEIAIRFAVVLAFAAIGEWVAQKAGTMNISVEAMILAAAFAAAVGYDVTGIAFGGIIFGVAGSLIVAGIQANMSQRIEVNQFVVGLSLNVLILALVSFLLVSIQPVSQITSNLTFPGLSQIPIVGEALFNQSWLLYLVIPVGFLGWYLIYKTRWGLEVRAVGQNPKSAEAMGVAVGKRRRQAIYFCGLTSGLAGAYLLLGQVGRFETSIVGGQGFIVLATVIFGGWRLGGTLWGCGIFGFIAALRLVLPAVGHPFNTELLSALPFIVTILLVGLVAHHRSRKSQQPAALGEL